MLRVAIVGAGFSGSVIACELAKNDFFVDVFETRQHVAGNCYTFRDKESGIMIHKYGPHIFHTSNLRCWDYIRSFDLFANYVNRVKVVCSGAVYSMPINLHTINQFFSRVYSPSEAEKFIKSIALNNIYPVISFEDQALRLLGEDLYKAFLKGYTEKQWGLSPSVLPASILKRLPVRFNYDDNYYSSLYQGMPIHGYTHIIEKMLDHPNISVHLNSFFKRSMARDYDHVFYTGPLDAWFDHSEGRLGYRTLDFVEERHDGDYQGNAVINYADPDVPWTRISEHKHFAPWEKHEKTVIFKEYSRACGPDDIPYYPIRLVNDKELLKRYVDLARAERDVTFVGRLATYRYLDMHQAIAEALDVAEHFIACKESGHDMPAFLIDPLG